MQCVVNQASFILPGPLGEIDLWRPVDLLNLVGAEADVKAGWKNVQPWCQEMIEELAVASGMTQENVAPIEEARRKWQRVKEFNDHIDRMEKELVDYEAPSYFNEWDQSTGFSRLIRDSRGNATKFTPEMLIQQDNLNELFNFGPTKTHIASNPGYDEPPPGLHDPNTLSYPDFLPNVLMSTGETFSIIACDIEPIECDLEIVSIGDTYGIAKCKYGGVFVPKSSLKHLNNLKHEMKTGMICCGGDNMEVGQCFRSWISFESDACLTMKFPWRIDPSVGITHIY